MAERAPRARRNYRLAFTRLLADSQQVQTTISERSLKRPSCSTRPLHVSGSGLRANHVHRPYTNHDDHSRYSCSESVELLSTRLFRPNCTLVESLQFLSLQGSALVQFVASPRLAIPNELLRSVTSTCLSLSRVDCLWERTWVGSSFRAWNLLYLWVSCLHQTDNSELS